MKLVQVFPPASRGHDKPPTKIMRPPRGMVYVGWHWGKSQPIWASHELTAHFRNTTKNRSAEPRYEVMRPPPS